MRWELQLFPGGRNVADLGTVAEEAFVEVEIEVSVHGDGLGDTGTDEVVGVIATTTEGETSLRGIDGSGKSGVATEVDGGVVCCSKVAEAQGISAIHEALAGKGERTSIHIDLQATATAKAGDTDDTGAGAAVD